MSTCAKVTESPNFGCDGSPLVFNWVGMLSLFSVQSAYSTGHITLQPTVNGYNSSKVHPVRTRSKSSKQLQQKWMYKCDSDSCLSQLYSRQQP
jgi:hypothetical protein